MGQSPQVI
ncbi:hypothetical protein D030_1711A, partial [Vibrio parahaemolyticus AQ3810]